MAGSISMSNTSPTSRGCRSHPEEEQKIGAQLGNILGYIEKLKEVDVTGVEPTAHAFPAGQRHPAGRSPRPRSRNEDALRNAPAQANGLFIVPKIVE